LKKAQENPEPNAVGGITMPIRNLRYNNDEILRKRCKEVPIIDDKIKQILDDMMDTLHQTENGAALAES
jgi:peptide deformylase